MLALSLHKKSDLVKDMHSNSDGKHVLGGERALAIE